jgi:hypothetical protein
MNRKTWRGFCSVSGALLCRVEGSQRTMAPVGCREGSVFALNSTTIEDPGHDPPGLEPGGALNAAWETVDT